MDAFIIEQTFQNIEISSKHVVLLFFIFFPVINFNSLRKNAMDIKNEKRIAIEEQKHVECCSKNLLM